MCLYKRAGFLQLFTSRCHLSMMTFLSKLSGFSSSSSSFIHLLRRYGQIFQVSFCSDNCCLDSIFRVESRAPKRPSNPQSVQDAGICCQCVLKTRRPVLWRSGCGAMSPCVTKAMKTNQRQNILKKEGTRLCK